MGQEASLPTDVADDLDEQGRAPPSSTNPPTAAAAASSAASSGTGTTTSSAAAAAGGTSTKRPGKMIGAMFHRHNNNNNNAATSATLHNAENFESREAARAAASGGNLYLADDDNDVDDSNSSSNNDYYAGQNGGQQHEQPPPPPPPPPQQQQYSSEQQPSGEQAVVSVMYEGKAPSKKGLSRAGARGAALIHSMRNLSLGGALRGGGGSSSNKQQQHAQQSADQVVDWEKQWDEDDDDSEEEDAVGGGGGIPSQQQTGVASPTAPTTLPLHQIRPGMDAGHSSVPQQQQQQQAALELQQLASPTAQAPLSPNSKQQQARYVTPDIMSLPVSPSSPHQRVGLSPGAGPAPTFDLLSEPAVLPAMIPADDGMEWDTAAVPEQDNLKPHVQMFMPMLRVLGKGSFGKVVLVQKSIGKERGQLFAMKILRKTHLVKRRQIERTRTERKVLSVVNHPFIMKLHYAFQSHDKLYLVLDYCPGGELFFHLSRFRRFPERVARFYAAELLLAIGHLHKRGIIYRDLKPENVLLDADGHVKLGDFGLAKAGIRHPFEGAVSMCGTPEYMAPEVLAQQGHGFCVDYWGLGMLVYEMMTGLPPWYTTDRAKLFRRLKSAPLDIPSYFSAQSANCVSTLLERNPRRRLGVTGIRTAMEHDFFRNISWRSLYARRVEAPIRPCEGWTAPEGTKEDLLDMGNGSASDNASDIEKLNSQDLEAATANFDNTFTRMPVESVDQGHGEGHEDEGTEELNEDTFVGFTFDGKDPDPGSASSSRQRSQNYAGTQAPQFE